jgi:hypothetical protein
MVRSITDVLPATMAKQPRAAAGSTDALPGGAPTAVFARLLDLARRVHLAPTEPSDRRRAFADALCRLVHARRAVVTVSGMDAATGRQVLMSAESAEVGTGGVAAPAAGPCLETFLSLDGIRRVACITLTRDAGRPKFRAAERALVELVHSEFAWLYTPSDPSDGRSGRRPTPRTRQRSLQ